MVHKHHLRDVVLDPVTIAQVACLLGVDKEVDERECSSFGTSKCGFYLKKKSIMNTCCIYYILRVIGMRDTKTRE